MFKSYLKITLRQLGKQKFYSAIKIGGFALGIATCLLIALYIRSELSYDRDYPDGDRLYRVVAVFTDNGKSSRGVFWEAPFARALKDEFPAVEKVARIMPSSLFWGGGSNQFLPLGGSEDTYEEGFVWADSTLPDLFGMKMIYGDRARALRDPYTLLISRRKAEKYWPGQDPIGKLVVLNGEKDKPWKIAGVMENPSVHSHLSYDFYLSMTGHQLWKGEQDYWMANNYITYVRLRAGTDVGRFENGLQVITKKYLYRQMTEAGNKDAEKVLKNLSYSLQPVKDIHLDASLDEDGLAHGDQRYVWLFGAVAFFILLLAGVNFINLSTARSVGRAKEVGLRKVVGARRSGLVGQFLTESLVLSGFSFLLAIGLALALLPLFNKIAGTTLSFPWREWWLAPLIILSAIVVGVLAGLYPSFYLSAFRPALVLKGFVPQGGRHSGLRSVLVVFQFTASVILIIATMVVYNQMSFILHTKLGFDKDQVLLIQGTGSLDRQLPDFKSQLQKLPGVKGVTISDYLPVSGGKRNMNMWWNEGRRTLDAGVRAQRWYVDVDYLSVMGMKIAEGRNFSPLLQTDSQAVVINRTMARQFGWARPLGQKITNGGKVLSVIGVVDDFNFETVKQEVGPLCMILGNWSKIVAVKVNTADMEGLIKSIGGVWKGYAPQQAYRYTFLDEQFERMYADVGRMGNIFTTLSALAVIIACLGLFALSAFMAEQRRKEIGIRKTLGATVMQVVGLLTQDFIRLVGIAILIATPIAWWVMHKWLENYVYRTSLGWRVFAGAGVVVVGIALVTISFQALKAAAASPVKALRSATD